MNIYRNLWAKSFKKPDFYENKAPLFLKHRGFKVYEIFNYGKGHQQYDFVLNDACVTQRAGASKAKEVIDNLLEGKERVCQAVKDYFLKNHGIKFKEYSEE